MAVHSPQSGYHAQVMQEETNNMCFVFVLLVFVVVLFAMSNGCIVMTNYANHGDNNNKIASA